MNSDCNSCGFVCKRHPSTFKPEGLKQICRGDRGPSLQLAYREAWDQIEAASQRKQGAFCEVSTDEPNSGKRLVITVATGHKFHELLDVTEPLMRAYSARIGADFVALRNETQSWWGLEKFRVKKFARAYDRTLFVDCDVILRSETPDMFSLVPPGSVGLHQDYPHLTQDAWLKTEWAAVMASQGVPRVLPEQSCLNTGVVVCDKSTAYIWDAPPRPLPGQHCDEQLWIESTIRTFGVPVVELHSSLNCQWWMRDFAKREPLSSVVHLANCPIDERTAMAKRLAGNNAGNP